MDENYNIVPHGVNFQDPIFPDTAEVHRMFASLFQFSNCTSGTQVHQYTPEWEAQEDSRVCSISNGKITFAFYNVFFALKKYKGIKMFCQVQTASKLKLNLHN